MSKKNNITKAVALAKYIKKPKIKEQELYDMDFTYSELHKIANNKKEPRRAKKIKRHS